MQLKQNFVLWPLGATHICWVFFGEPLGEAMNLMICRCDNVVWYTTFAEWFSISLRKLKFSFEYFEIFYSCEAGTNIF